MKLFLPHKHLVVFASLSVLATILVVPTRAEWMMNQYGDLINQSSVVLGESTDTTSPELEELFKGDASMQREFESITRELAQPLSDTASTKPGQKATATLERKPRSGLSQIRVAAPGAPKREPKEEEDIFGGLDKLGGSDDQLNIDIMPKEGEDQTLRQEKFMMQKGDKQVEFSPSTKDPKTLEMRRDEFKAKLKFPVKIDPLSQEIRVETAVGDLPIRVMPEEARSKMEAKHQLNLNDTAPDTPQVVDGKLTYTYEGTESKKLFGFFPVKLNKKVMVSAEDGAVTEEKQASIFGRFLDYWAE
jgi:hypothetical protein